MNGSPIHASGAAGNVSELGRMFAAVARLVLSLFPGIDLLGMGFEGEGFCVVRGPDPLFGGDIRGFHPVPDVFAGIIAGSPCQDFSRLRRCPPSGLGLEMLGHFERCVTEAAPDWFLLENVPGVPDVAVDGYTVQRMNVRASEFGATSHRLRALQFGYLDGGPLVLPRLLDVPEATQAAALASEGGAAVRRGWVEFCAVQGLVPAPVLKGWTKAGKYRAVGNGVHLSVSRAVAIAIAARGDTAGAVCGCGCGRPLTGRYGQRFAVVACRKRAQRQRDVAGAPLPRTVTL